MHVSKIPFWISLLLALSLPGGVFAGIYKWMDDEGKVHFGDSPPAVSESESIQLKPSNTSQGLNKVEERLGRQNDGRKQLEEGGKGDPEQVAQPVSSIGAPPDVECFTPLADALDGVIAYIREPIKSKPLTRQELGRLEALFRASKGRWKGELEEVACHREDATPPSVSTHYDYRLKSSWKPGRRFEIDIELEYEGNEYNWWRQLYFMWPGEAGLRFNTARSYPSFDIDQPRYDVEIVSIDKGDLLFFTRILGAIHKTEVYSFRLVGQSFEIREFFFTQGILSAKRLWKAKR